MTSTLYSILARIALTLALIALALALGLTVVTAQDVGYNAMPGADFSKDKTYKWVKIEGAPVPRSNHGCADQVVDRWSARNQGPHQDRG